MFRPRVRTFAPAVLALSLGLSACGGGIDDQAAPVTASEEGFSIGGAASGAVADPNEPSTVDPAPVDGAQTPDTTVDAVSTTTAPGAPETTAPPVLSSTEPVSLARAAGATAVAETGRFDLRVRMVGEIEGTAIDGAMTIGLEVAPGGDTAARVDMGGLFDAAFASASPEEQAEMALFVDALSSPMEIREIDGVSYVRGGFISMFIGIDPETWLIDEDGSAGSVDEGAGEFVGTADDILAGFGDANTELIEVGRESFDGVDVTRYRADVDPVAVDGLDLGTGEGLGVASGETVPIDLWVDDAGQLRRFTMTLDASMLEGDNEGMERVEIIGEWTQLGENFEIEVPTGLVLTSEEAAAQSDGGIFGELFEELDGSTIGN